MSQDSAMTRAVSLGLLINPASAVDGVLYSCVPFDHTMHTASQHFNT